MGTYRPNRQILYVDDDGGVLSSFSSLMKRENVELSLLQDPADIKNRLTSEGPFAVVLSDQRMPQCDGASVLATVAQIHPDSVRIIVTGYADHGETLRAINVGGAEYYVQKPWDDADMRRLVAECIDRYNLVRENRHLLEEIASTQSSLRALAEERLRENVEEFRAIAANVDDMIEVLDGGGRRIYASPSCGRIRGEQESAPGKDIVSTLPPEDGAIVRRLLDETAKDGGTRRCEYRLTDREGVVRTLEAKASPVRGTGGELSRIIVVSRDRTEEKNLEAQILRAQRMESIGTLAGGIAHDLNNILAPILMSIHLLQSRIADPDLQHLLATMRSSAQRGSDIVRQVLAFGRGVTNDLEFVQLKHILAEMISIAGETFPKTIRIRPDVAGDLWPVSADPTQMHQVLLNLFVNARDAMPGGGTLTVSARNATLDETYATMIPGGAPGRYAMIAVSDTGTGIPEAIRGKIFDPFFTTKAAGAGTGLGLSTTLAIVKGHNGFIALESGEGKGTTFSVYIPATAMTDEQTAIPGEKEIPTGNGALVLVIEDEAAVREITKETLQAYGYRVLCACDGAEGLALFAERRHEIRAVITDMIMPIVDGQTAIRAIRHLSPDISIIASSGFAPGVHHTPPDAPHVNAYLQKPYTARTLLTTLGAALP